jgi:Flp pilus assembly protein TadB
VAPGALVEIDRVEAVSRDPVLFFSLVDLLTLRLVVAVVVAFPLFLVKFLVGSVARRRLKAKKEEKVQLFKLHCNLLDP